LRNHGKPEGAEGRIALPVSGDNADAKAVVLQLVNEIGFDAFDNGGIDNSWRQQPGTPVYTKDFDLEGLKAGLQKADKTRTPQWSATDRSPGSFEQPA
jgi:predicted dinucleotide-binding enzyme